MSCRRLPREASHASTKLMRSLWNTKIMAQDGSQSWDGGKGAFSHLLHHPRDPDHRESYRQPGPAAQSPKAQASTGNTGTWNGPAPTGNLGDERRSTAATSIPDSILLPGGTKMPLIGYGTYKINSADNVREALAAGYRHFDCARKYDNEQIIGDGLESFLGESPQNRSKLFITSKVWNDCHRPELIRKSCDQTLAELRCGHLDLLLVHWPDAFKPGTEEPDTEITLKETWEVFEQLVDEGKTKNIGVSNFSLTQIEGILEFARIKPVVNQIELHPELAQRKLVGTSLRKGVYSVAYSPLGHGDMSIIDLPEVQKVAQESGRPATQVVLKWNIQRGVPVIPRSSQKKNLEANIKGLFDWELSPTQKAALDGLDKAQRKVSPSWHTWDDPALGGALKPSANY